MDAFADLEYYEERYGAASDPSRVETLLGDAAGFLALELRRSRREIDPEDELQQDALKRISCRIVHDQVSADEDLAGVSSAMETVGPYTWQRSFTQSYGKPFLYADEKRQLGIGGIMCGSVAPIGRAI